MLDAPGVFEGPGVNVITGAGVLVDVGGGACVRVSVDVGVVDSVGVFVGLGVTVIGAQLARTRQRIVRKMIFFIVFASTLQLRISFITL
jgi:hypothetical protein